ncbi:MAG: DUF5667 domain-containing protein [Anaerolineae bacterium]
MMTAGQDAQQDQIRRQLQALRPVPPRAPKVVAERRAAFLRACRNATLLRGAACARSPRFRLAAIAIGLALLIVVSSGLTVSAAQTALPGDPLYAIKVGAEQVRLALTFNQAARAERMVARVVTRARELDLLAFSHPEQIRPADLERFSEQAEAAHSQLLILSQTDASLAETLLVRLQEATSLRQGVILGIDGEMPAKGPQLGEPQESRGNQPRGPERASGGSPQATLPTPQQEGAPDQVATSAPSGSGTNRRPVSVSAASPTPSGASETTGTPHRIAEPTLAGEAQYGASATPSSSGSGGQPPKPSAGGADSETGQQSS